MLSIDNSIDLFLRDLEMKCLWKRAHWSIAGMFVLQETAGVRQGRLEYRRRDGELPTATLPSSQGGHGYLIVGRERRESGHQPNYLRGKLPISTITTSSANFLPKLTMLFYFEFFFLQSLSALLAIVLLKPLDIPFKTKLYILQRDGFIDF